MDVNKIAVIGSGTMGNGICHVFALNGFDTHLMDVNEEALQKALNTITQNMDRQIAKGSITEEDKTNALARIKTFQDMKSAVWDVDLVVEAVVENMDVKGNIFEHLSEMTQPHTILASNTSSVSITRLGSRTNKQEKVIGMHFMNPVPVMKLVEVINGYGTSEDTTQTILDLCKKIEKVPCVSEDYPGFISNRILLPMINEAIISLQEGVAGVEDIDTIMKLGMAHPMGPLQLADFIGLDTCHSILTVMQTVTGKQKFAPATLLVNMVQAKKLGRKTGEGFYKYTLGSKDLIVSDQFKKKR